MPVTMQQVIDRARVPLNDDDKVRYSDADGLVYANDAIKMLQNERPDLFFGQFEALPSDKLIGEDLPLADTYIPAVVDYVSARWEFRDDEAIVEGKATTFFGLFKASAGA